MNEPTNAPHNEDRRHFLKLLGVGGLVLVAGPKGITRLEAAERAFASWAEPWSPVAYVVLHDDGMVTLICHRSEMGQGIRTTMPMIIADEMEADWTRCRVEQALGNEKKYGSQNTDGSTSIRNFLPQYRSAGATMRALLEDAAAKTWSVPVTEVRAEQHRVLHDASKRALTFAELLPTARTLPMPDAARVRVKRPAERRWQGKVMPSVDLHDMTVGAARYGADVTRPGMKYAAIARPFVWGGKVATVDESAALKVPGVERIVRMPEPSMPSGHNPLGGVAVIANSTWAAMQGRDALRITWDNGANATYESAAYKATLKASVQQPGKAGRSVGDADAALAAASRTISQEYYVPHLSHAPMEPLVALAEFTNGMMELWAPTQSPGGAGSTIAGFLKLEPAQVKVNVTLLGGAFGRKSKHDFMCEAAFLAREIGAPVRVQWTREDDMRHDFLHTVAAHKLDAALDASGKVTAWRHRSAYPSISATFAPNVAGPNPSELTNGASDIPYDIPNMSVEACPAVAHTRIGWYRSVNAIHHGFAIGSFVDELAFEAKQDPREFLLTLVGPDRQWDLSEHGLAAPAGNYGAKWADHPLDTVRAKRVVSLAAEKAGWGSTLPRGRGRGLAMHRSFLSYIAMVVEVEVEEDGTVLVPRATVAVDAGFVANPDRARAQMEGALIMAMSNTLYSEISFRQGRVRQSNFRDYDVTRLRAAPHVVDVHLVESEGLPGGIGEPGVPPAGAAIANAIFAATGTRVRDLPVAKQLAGWKTRAAQL